MKRQSRYERTMLGLCVIRKIQGRIGPSFKVDFLVPGE